MSSDGDKWLSTIKKSISTETTMTKMIPAIGPPCLNLRTEAKCFSGGHVGKGAGEERQLTVPIAQE